MSREKIDINAFYKTDNIRLYVIEHTLYIETLMSEAIGNLLGVNYKESKSFGFSSSALSFSQKVQIVQDIKGLESEMDKKLTSLMNIRNKFAHVQEIDSFDKLFEIASNGTQIKNQLEKWYNLEEKNEHDENYKFLFFKLADEIILMLKILSILTTQENEIREDKIKIQSNILNMLLVDDLEPHVANKLKSLMKHLK